MELRINTYQIPEKITFNFEELKQELTSKTEMYETLVYTDNQISEAKKDRANLNKLKDALNNERKRLENEYMIPFNNFKAEVNEIIGIIEKPIAVIDKQIKEYDKQQKDSKLKEIRNLWESLEHSKEMRFESVFSESMLNKSFSMKKVNQYFVDAIDKFNRESENIIEKVGEFAFEAMEVYKSTLDMNAAFTEARRLSEQARRKAEHEERMQKLQQEKEEQELQRMEQMSAVTENPKAESDKAAPVAPVAEPVREAVCFRAYLTTEDAFALRDFFVSRSIPFEAI